MKIKSKTLQELHQDLIDQKITPLEIVEAAFAKIKKYNDKYNLFINTFEAEALTIAKAISATDIKKPFGGIPISIKDTFVYKNHVTTGGSALLSDFRPSYNATVIDEILHQGGILVGKNTTDELGMAGTGTFCYTGVVKNPWNVKYITSGSSSGSAVSVALGITPISICSDTGDSVRKPAAFLGVCGFKPSYGLISRFGMFPYSPSLDTVGIIAKSVADLAYSFKVIQKYDDKDLTSQKATFEIPSKMKVDHNFFKGKKVAILKILEESTNKNIQHIFKKHVNQLRSLGAQVEYFDFDTYLLKSLLPIYMVISYAESTSCSSNLTGWYFGHNYGKNDWLEAGMNNRYRYFGQMLKHRFTLGTFFLSETNIETIFRKSKKIRRLIFEKMNEIFSKYDVLLTPTNGSLTPTLEKTLNAKSDVSAVNNLADNILLLANFAGTPSLTIPMGFVEDLPIGMNVNTQFKRDDFCLEFSHHLEQLLDIESRDLEEVLNNE